MTRLNMEQQAAADFLNGICSVVAVPGSGKTLTMTERIGKLVKNHGVAPEQILGLTFTRNAAQAMRDRLIPVLDDLASRVMLATIHSFCFYMIKSEGRIFDILSGKDQIIFVKEILKRLKLKDLSPGMVLQEVSLAKNNLITVDEFRDLYQGDKTMLKIADAFDSYEHEKDRRMLLDFDDLLVDAHRILSGKEEVKERYRERFQHILVDEFQDTNPAQMEILKSLKGDSSNGSSFWVCGDDWQAIYGFTGASVGNILNFNDMFPGSTEFILSVNYRSTPQILKGCQNLIQHNNRQIRKTLATDNVDGEDVIVLESASDEGEAMNLVTEIRELIERDDYIYKDIVVLYRANFQSRVVEEVFAQQKIPYHIENGLNFYARREVKLLLDYLRLIDEPDCDAGDEALLSVINVPNRYFGRKFTDEVKAFADKRGMHLYQALRSMPVELAYLRKNVGAFVELMESMIEEAEAMSPGNMIDLLRCALDYDRYITDDDIPSPDDVKIENLNQLQLSASKYKNISSFLEYTDSFQDQAISNDKEGVSLMTIHKAKGLEFPVVFVIGLVEGIMPSSKGDIEEERRICFVGISRAMEILYVSYSHTHLGQPAKKSIFLDEILNCDETC